MKINLSVQVGDVETAYMCDAGSRSIYVFRFNDVPVLQAVIDNDDTDLTIYVRRWGSDDMIKTNGRAVRALHELPASDGGEVPDGLANHVDGLTVYSYVVPRLLRFITELYVNQA